MDHESKQAHVAIHWDGRRELITLKEPMDDYARANDLTHKPEICELWRMINAVLIDFKNSRVTLSKMEMSEIRSVPMNALATTIHRIISTKLNQDIHDVWYYEFVEKYRKICNKEDPSKLLNLYQERRQRIKGWKCQSFFRLLRYCQLKAWKGDRGQREALTGIYADYGDSLIPASDLFGDLGTGDGTTIESESTSRAEDSMNLYGLMGETLCATAESEFPAERRRDSDVQSTEIYASSSHRTAKSGDGMQQELNESSESPLDLGYSLYGSFSKDDTHGTSAFSRYFRSESQNQQLDYAGPYT